MQQVLYLIQKGQELSIHPDVRLGRDGWKHFIIVDCVNHFQNLFSLYFYFTLLNKQVSINALTHWNSHKFTVAILTSTSLQIISIMRKMSSQNNEEKYCICKRRLGLRSLYLHGCRVFFIIYSCAYLHVHVTVYLSTAAPTLFVPTGFDHKYT